MCDAPQTLEHRANCNYQRRCPAGGSSMWFRLFVLLRSPISVYLLLGYAWAGQFGVVLFLTLFLSLPFVSIHLARFRPGRLLALEVLRPVLRVGVDASATPGSLDEDVMVRWFCIIGGVWVFPNAAILYKARSLFTEPAKEEPGA